MCATNRTFISLAVDRNVIAENGFSSVYKCCISAYSYCERTLTTIQCISYIIILRRIFFKDNRLNLNEKHFRYSKTHTEYKVGLCFLMQFDFKSASYKKNLEWIFISNKGTLLLQCSYGQFIVIRCEPTCTVKEIQAHRCSEQTKCQPKIKFQLFQHKIIKKNFLYEILLRIAPFFQ